MHFEGPVLPVAGPLIGALLTFPLSRRRRSAAIAGAIATWVLWAMVKAIPLAPTAVEEASRLFSGDSLLILGRSLLLTEMVRELILLLYLGTSLLFLLSLLFHPGRYFIPASLASLAFLTAALMIEPFSFGAVSLLLAASLLAVVIQGERAGTARVALRYLTMVAMAVPMLLVYGWMVSGERTALLLTASRLLAGGSIILLAGFPVFFWVKPIVEETFPLASVFIFGLFQTAITAFIFKLLLADAFLEANDSFTGLLFWSGAGTVLVAGLMAFATANPLSFLGHCLLLDMGMTVLALAVGGTVGWEVAMALQFSRFVSLLLAMVGVSILRRRTGLDAVSDGRGIARSFPLGTALMLFGCASLLGLPLTVGFSGRWALFAAIKASQGPAWLPYLLLLAMMGGTFGLVGSLVRMLNQTKAVTAVTEVGNRWRDGLSTTMLLVGIWLALFPQAAFRIVSRLADLMRN